MNRPQAHLVGPLKYRPLDRSAKLVAVVAYLLFSPLNPAYGEPPADPGKAAEKENTPAQEEVEASPTEEDPFTAFLPALRATSKKVSRGNMLEQVNGYKALNEEYSKEDPQIADLLASYLSWKLSSLGEYAEALRVFDVSSIVEAPKPEVLEIQEASLEGLESQDAVEAIARASVGQRAVFINEAHHVPQHRALTHRLLPFLRQQGFTHFAAETLAPRLEELKEKGYPTSKTGTYTDEPLYADLVRRALALGFEIIPYEAVGMEERKDRELSQARHLKERVFDAAPEARLVVHLGYGHNRESATAYNGKPTMAHHFEEITGIDPLTIDQTDLTEHSAPTYEYPFYARLCGGAESAAPIVYKTSEGALWSLPEGNRDITVCLPRTLLEHGRPTWLELGGLRKFVPLEQDICRQHSECLVEARPEGESQESIAIDRIRVEAGQPAPALALPPGTFQISAQQEDGTEIRSWKVIVQK